MINDEQRQQFVKQHHSRDDDTVRDYLVGRGVPRKDVQGVGIGMSRVSDRRYLLGSWSTFDLPAGFTVVDAWDYAAGLWGGVMITHYTLIEEGA